MSEPTLREQQLEQLVKWCLTRLKKQGYVDIAKRRMAQCPHEWKAEKDEFGYVEVVLSDAALSTTHNPEEK